MRALLPTWRPGCNPPPSAGDAANSPAGRTLAPLLDLVEDSNWLIASSIGEFYAGEELFQIPRFIFMGPKAGGDTVRLGIFGTLHGHEGQGAEAIVDFLQQLEHQPELAAGYHIYTYPICNPSGFAAGTRCNAAGQDLMAHFWRGSNQPEAYYLEREIGVHHFNGLISVGSTDDVSPRFFFNGGRNSVLRDALASPAMLATRMFLTEAPPKTSVKSDASAHAPKSDAAGFLTKTDELHPLPFEINFEIPRLAPQRTQIVCTVNALKSILGSYRTLLAIQPNL